MFRYSVTSTARFAGLTRRSAVRESRPKPGWKLAGLPFVTAVHAGPVRCVEADQASAQHELAAAGSLLELTSWKPARRAVAARTSAAQHVPMGATAMPYTGCAGSGDWQSRRSPFPVGQGMRPSIRHLLTVALAFGAAALLLSACGGGSWGAKGSPTP